MVEVVNGELVELTAAEIAERRQREADKHSRERDHLERIAKQRGYKPNWVNHILEARAAKKVTTPIDPYGTIKDWKGEKNVTNTA
jgi:hypothetical protein